MHGKIWAVKDDTVIVEVARDVRIEMDKSAIRRRLDEPAATPIKKKER